MSFLKAEWRKLVMVNYEVDPKVLSPHLPKGTILDLWEGKCYVSLVGFMFLNTSLLGIKIPFHINFEEVNLRFYVKRLENEEWRRGVVFIKEIVPKAALTFIANTVYKEHYETQKMSHDWSKNGTSQTIKYEWGKNSLTNSVEVTCSNELQKMQPNSKEEFIAEHYWGYAKVSETQTNEYEVVHLKWEHYPTSSALVQVDFGMEYGSEFAFLNDSTPNFTIVAEGSTISVEQKNNLSF